MKKYPQYPKCLDDFPDKPIWVIVTSVSFDIKEDESAKRNGYYDRTEKAFQIEYYEDEEDWKNEVIRLSGLLFKSKFKAFKMIPAKVSTSFSVSVE